MAIQDPALNMLKLSGKGDGPAELGRKDKAGLVVGQPGRFCPKPEQALGIPFILDKIKDNYSSGNTFAILFNEKVDAIAAIVKSSQQALKFMAAFLRAASSRETP